MARRSLKKDHLWKVFRILPSGKVDFYGGVGTWGHNSNRAILWRTKSDANGALQSGYDKRFQHGIAPESATVTEIKKAVKGRASSARGKAKRRTGRRRKNPVGPTQKEVDNAMELYKDFRGDYPEGSEKVKIPTPKVGVVVGELDGVLYTTVRDGKKEHYQHDFKKGSRPLLASSHDGKSIHILGGEYEFTERGIEDR